MLLFGFHKKLPRVDGLGNCNDLQICLIYLVWEYIKLNYGKINEI